jgi:integrase
MNRTNKPKKENEKKLLMYLNRQREEIKPKPVAISPEPEVAIVEPTPVVKERRWESGAAACMPLDIDKVKEVSKQKIASDKYHDRNYGALLWLGVITGLRWVDLHQLRRFNLDFENGRCMIIGAAHKTGKTYNKAIPIHLLELMEEIAMEGDEGLIFHNKGKKYTAQWMRDRIKSDFSDAYEKSIRESKRRNKRLSVGIHSLRKTYGLEIYKEKGINGARQALQHEDSATTCRYLGVGWEEQLRDEIEAMQKHW